MKKKIFSIALTSILAVTALAGCGAGTGKEAAETTAADKITLTNVSYDPKELFFQG